MKKIGILALLLVLCVFGCCLTACSKTYVGKVPENLIEKYGFGGMKLIDNDDTEYCISYQDELTVRTNIDSYEDYKEFCKYVYDYVTSVDGVVVAGSVESVVSSHSIFDEFIVDNGDGLEQGYYCYNTYAYTTSAIGENKLLNGVHVISVLYNMYGLENSNYNLELTIYNSDSRGTVKWYYDVSL